jgi:hypothetical protein
MYRYLLFFKKRLPGVGSQPGASQLHLFTLFHHFTAEPQRLSKEHALYTGTLDSRLRQDMCTGIYFSWYWTNQSCIIRKKCVLPVLQQETSVGRLHHTIEIKEMFCASTITKILFLRIKQLRFLNRLFGRDFGLSMHSHSACELLTQRQIARSDWSIGIFWAQPPRWRQPKTVLKHLWSFSSFFYTYVRS